MQDSPTGSVTPLNYAGQALHSLPRRPWILIFFLALIFYGEMVIPRSSRWPWPMLEDYLLLGFMFIGAILQSFLSSLPPSIIGVYGLVGLAAFWDGQFHDRSFLYDPNNAWAVAWLVAFVSSWAICRALPLLMRRRSSQH